MADSDHTTAGRRPRRAGLVAASIIAIGALFALAGIYGIGAIERNPQDAVCRGAVETAKRMAPFSRGEVAAVAVSTRPRQVPDLTFRDADNRERPLAEWRGRVVLLNLWATWCVPCRKEMPALDALEQKLGGPGFEVVAVNIDTRNPERAPQWLKQAGVTRLVQYSDPTAKLFQDLKAFGRAMGMPTTLLIDAQGCELGYLAGPAEWASEDAIKLITAALGK